MRQNPSYILSDVAGNHILLPVGNAVRGNDNMLTLNEIGADIWRLLEQETSFESLVASVMDRYDVDETRAKESVRRFTDRLTELGCILETEE